MLIESELRTDRDMTDEENVKDAQWRLDRCTTDGDYAYWAKALGYALIKACLENLP